MNIKKKLGILLIVIIVVSGLVGYYRVSYARKFRGSYRRHI